MTDRVPLESATEEVTLWLTFDPDRYMVREFGRPFLRFRPEPFWDVGDDVETIVEDLTDGRGEAEVYCASPFDGSGCVLRVHVPTREDGEALLLRLVDDIRLAPDTVTWGEAAP